MPMRNALPLALVALLIVASTDAAESTSLGGHSEPTTISKKGGEDQQADRIRSLERLLAPSDDERQAELVYLASIEFLGFLQKMRSQKTRPGQITDLDRILSDPRSYRIRIRDDGKVLYVVFLPKNERIRGGGVEIGINQVSGATVSIQPMM